MARRTNEPFVRPSTAKDLPRRLLASENPTPTETDFPQSAKQTYFLVFWVVVVVVGVGDRPVRREVKIQKGERTYVYI